MRLWFTQSSTSREQLYIVYTSMQSFRTNGGASRSFSNLLACKGTRKEPGELALVSKLELKLKSNLLGMRVGLISDLLPTAHLGTKETHQYQSILLSCRIVLI